MEHFWFAVTLPAGAVAHALGDTVNYAGQTLIVIGFGYGLAASAAVLTPSFVMLAQPTEWHYE